MLPILRACGCVNQTLPSGPSTIIAGRLSGVRIANSLTLPDAVTRAMRFALSSANHRLPSLPPTISAGPAPLGNSISVRVPVVLSRPMRLPECSVNQRLPSAPNVIPAGPLSEWGRLTYAIFPSGATRPIRLPKGSVNQTAPSGPAVIRSANPSGSIGKRLVAPYGVMRPMPSPWNSVNHKLPSGPAVIAYGAWVPTGAPVGVGFALGVAAATTRAGFDGSLGRF